MSRIDFHCIFFILINIFSFSIQNFNICEPILINPDEFDFTAIIKGLHFTIPQVKNNKIIQAFDYENIDIIKYQFENIAIQTKLKEKNKFSVLLESLGLSGIEKLWNWSSYKETQLLTKKYIFEGIFEKLDKLMANHKWVDNNVILIAYSIKEECFESDVKFHFVKEIAPKNNFEKDIYENIYENFAIETCLKKTECEEIYECFDNLLAYNECIIKRRSGLSAEICPIFTKNCKLRRKKEINYSL